MDQIITPTADQLPDLIRLLPADKQAMVVDVALNTIADAEFEIHMANDPAFADELEASLIAASEEADRLGCATLEESKTKFFSALNQ